MLNPPLKYRRAFIVPLMLVFAGSACTSATPISVKAHSLAPVPVTQVVTLLVTRDVTVEATRQVVVPVTVTPTNTPLYTFTPSETPTVTTTPMPGASPTIPPTPEPPVVSILEYSDCLYGPASFYLYKTSLPAGGLMEVVGRNPDGTWLDVQEVHGWNPCWIESARVKLITGDVKIVPVVYSVLPYSNQFAPPDASARRNGSEVTVSWKAVWMSFDDYRGYLIEAWVCRGGAQVFLPVSYAPALENNAGSLSVKITDEPGCDLPSHARVYSADKYGYSVWQIIFWPPS